MGDTYVTAPLWLLVRNIWPQRAVAWLGSGNGAPAGYSLVN